VRNRKLIFSLSLCLLGVFTTRYVDAQVYQCKDDKGRKIYQDRPCVYRGVIPDGVAPTPSTTIDKPATAAPVIAPSSSTTPPDAAAPNVTLSNTQPQIKTAEDLPVTLPTSVSSQPTSSPPANQIINESPAPAPAPRIQPISQAATLKKPISIPVTATSHSSAELSPPADVNKSTKKLATATTDKKTRAAVATVKQPAMPSAKISRNDVTAKKKIRQSSMRREYKEDYFIPGWRKGEFFYPEDQRWTITAVRYLSTVNVAEELKGIPAILTGAPVFFTSSYFTFRNVNAGDNMVIGACFTARDKQLDVEPVEQFKRALSQKIILKQTAGDQMEMILDDWLALTLTKDKLGDDFHYLKLQFDGVFNAALKRYKIQQADCDLVKIDVLAGGGEDLLIYAPAIDKQITLQEHILDPKTQISQGASYPLKRIRHEPGALEVEQCAALWSDYRLVKDQDNSNFFYITEIISGKSVSTSSFCNRLVALKKIDGAKIIELLGYAQKVDSLHLDFVDRLDDTSFIMQFRREGTVTVKFSDYDKNRIVVEVKNN